MSRGNVTLAAGPTQKHRHAKEDVPREDSGTGDMAVEKVCSLQIPCLSLQPCIGGVFADKRACLQGPSPLTDFIWE